MASVNKILGHGNALAASTNISNKFLILGTFKSLKPKIFNQLIWPSECSQQGLSVSCRLDCCCSRLNCKTQATGQVRIQVSEPVTGTKLTLRVCVCFSTNGLPTCNNNVVFISKRAFLVFREKIQANCKHKSHLENSKCIGNVQGEQALMKPQPKQAHYDSAV